jgi:hypothetical protein
MRGVAASRAVRTMRKSANVEKALLKLGIKGESEKLLFETIRNFVSTPVGSGILAYLAVSAIEQLVAPPKVAAQDPTKNPTVNAVYNYAQSVIGIYEKVLPLGQLGGLLGNTLSGNLSADFTALKIAIIVYIASGGNLAGLLSSGTNLLGSAAALAK